MRQYGDRQFSSAQFLEGLSQVPDQAAVGIERLSDLSGHRDDDVSGIISGQCLVDPGEG